MNGDTEQPITEFSNNALHNFYAQYVCVQYECIYIHLYLYSNITSKCASCLHACGQTPTERKTCALTFDRMQNSVVQGLTARVIGGRADACSTAVGQSIPDTSK